MIPKIVFQTSPQIVPDYIKKEFLEKGNSWEYIHFDDFLVLEFFYQNPSKEFGSIVEVFNSFKRGEHRADLFRYYFLFLKGGLFVDIDAIPEVNLDIVIKDYSLVLVNGFHSSQGFYNGIIGAEPGNEFIYQMLKYVYNSPPELLDDCYHYFCKAQQSLYLSRNNKKNEIVYNEVSLIPKGIYASQIINENLVVIFSHYFGYDLVPEHRDIDDLIKNKKEKKEVSGIHYIKYNIAKTFRKIKFLKKTQPYKAQFDDIYLNNKWEFGSGLGSTQENTTDYNDFLKKFILEKNIKQITDIGCGDWQSSHLIYNEFQYIDYLGIDIVKSVIESNKKKFPRYRFEFLDILDDDKCLRDSELFILKDVLQHLKTKDIYKLLDILTKKNYKYILIINYANQKKDDEELPFLDNCKISRGLSSNFYPLKKYNAIFLKKLFVAEEKEICLIFKDTNWNNYNRNQKSFFSKNLLLVHETFGKLKRVGPFCDGGYVIFDGIVYDAFFSCGIANDIAFEIDFLKSNKNLSCYAFDGTIEKFPINDSRIDWFKKNIGPFNTDTTTNLKFETENYNNIFIKLDIEGSEFDWLINADFDMLNKFAQIVIEYHWPFDQYRVKALQKILKSHSVVHVHGNNYNNIVIPKGFPSGRTDTGTEYFFNNLGEVFVFPEVFEVTYVRNDFISNEMKPIFNKKFPTNLDSPNCNLVNDISFEI